MKLANEFKQFLMRGNVIELAVAVVIGAAFGAVVKAIVEDLITPLLGILFKRDFATLTFTVRGSIFKYGDVINVLITVVLLAAVIFFLVIKPMNALNARNRKVESAGATTKKCLECLSDIPIAAKRCAYCTSTVA